MIDRMQSGVRFTVRMTMLSIAVTSLFFALFARLVYLQVWEQPELAAAARDNQLRTVFTEAPRGRILDRNGIVLAGDKEVDVLTVNRDAPTKDKTLLARLATFTGVPEATLRQRLEDPKASLYRPVPVIEDAEKSMIAAFREHQSEFEGVQAETRVERWYPHDTLAAHILGYTGEVTDTDLESKDDAKSIYRLGDLIGKAGLESAFENDLRGSPGVDKIEVDATGRPVRVLQHTDPVPGHDIKLAIDINTQRVAEQSLAEGLAKARTVRTPDGKESPAPAGSVVAIDPRDGGVRAMASFPTYQPAAFSGGIPYSEYAKLTDPSGSLPLNNRAIQGQYAPGSTFKLVTSVAALNSGLIQAGSTINDTGSFTLGDRRYQNALGKSYGTVNLSRSLTVSSDVFYYQLGARFWEQRKALGEPMQDTAKQFGFGVRQGIGIGGETPGRIPTPESRKKMHEEAPEAFPEANWYGGDNVNVSIGQGDTLVTPLQLANSYATFANGGTLYQPRLVLAVLNGDGSVARSVDSKVLGQANLPAGVKAPIEEGLIGAVNSPSGTAFSAFAGFDRNTFPVAGKTGTAQVNDKQDSALFAGYGPVGNAQVAVSVVMEEAGFGGTSAAPVGRQVLAQVAGQQITETTLGTGQD
jgi:penicillin-binding protein 2